VSFDLSGLRLSDLTHEDGLIILNLGVTGHRDLAHAETISAVLFRSLDEIAAFLLEKLPKQNFRIVLHTPVAEGADQLALWVFLDWSRRNLGRLPVRCSVQLVFPMPPEEYRRSFADQHGPSSLDAVIAKLVKEAEIADCFEMLPEILLEGTYESHHSGLRNNAFSRLIPYFQQQCDSLWALWDGVDLEETGGTSDVIRSLCRRTDLGQAHRCSHVFWLSVCRAGAVEKGGLHSWETLVLPKDSSG